MIRVATLFSGVGTPEQSLKHLKVKILTCQAILDISNLYKALQVTV